MANNKVWFITGVSRGFGRIWAEAALQRGDKVAATAREESSLNELISKFGENVLPLTLDVTDRSAQRYQQRLAVWEQWKELSEQAQGN